MAKSNKPKVPCPICGEMFASRGLPGHIRWKHKKDPKALMFNTKVQHPLKTAYKKAKKFDRVQALLSDAYQADSTYELYSRLCAISRLVPYESGQLEDTISPVLDNYCDRHGITQAKLTQEIKKWRRIHLEIAELLK
mgnify:CR=1 FL=1